jgi:outer membrane lipoprotein-sorting protein
MSFSEPKPDNTQELETMLTETFGPPPRDDIDAWRKRYPSALAWLNPQRIGVLSQRRRRMQRITILAATTAAAICVWLGLPHFGARGTGASAFAQTVDQIRKATDITWTTTIYERITSKDGKRHWYRSNVRKLAYKAPGLYRETSYDEDGNLRSVEITDAVNKKVLTLYPSDRTATIADIRPCKDPEGPFLDAQRMLKDYDLQFVERRKTAVGDVNVFRHSEGRVFFDCWIGQKTKRLVEYRINQNENVTLADYENDPMRNAKPERETSRGIIVGSIDNEIVYNANLDDSLFRFDVPEGYAVKTQKRHIVTEQEMIDCFRAMVEFNGKVFPDDLSQPSFDQLNKYRKMPAAARPPQAQKLIEIVDSYGKIQLSGLPLREFLLEHADWNSYRYFGKGFKLGDKEVIVCWYRLNEPKIPGTYRVIYGDLSVRDVAVKDLPLPVEP